MTTEDQLAELMQRQAGKIEEQGKRILALAADLDACVKECTSLQSQLKEKEIVKCPSVKLEVKQGPIGVGTIHPFPKYLTPSPEYILDSPKYLLEIVRESKLIMAVNHNGTMVFGEAFLVSADLQSRLKDAEDVLRKIRDDLDWKDSEWAVGSIIAYPQWLARAYFAKYPDAGKE
jgi:hypothetical protein